MKRTFLFSLVYFFILSSTAFAVEEFLYCRVTSLNVREGAGAKHKIIGKIKKFDAIKVTKKSNGWVYFTKKKFPSGGWVSRKYLVADRNAIPQQEKIKVIKKVKRQITTIPLNGWVGKIGYASDTQKGAIVAKKLAKSMIDSDVEGIGRFFVVEDSLLSVILNSEGDAAFAIGPHLLKPYMRFFIKSLRDYYGTTAVSLTLMESDQTPIGKASISILSGKINVKLF